MAGKRYAILIASSKYPDEPGLTELRCPENDVDALNEVLRSPEFGQFAKTVVLKNKPSHEVLEQIETVLHDAGREDLVLIYFSGHGKLNPSGQLCLAAANTKLRTLGSTSIPVERIKSFFDAADTRQRILILDCCYSGAVGKDFIKGGVDDQLQLMSGGQGTFIMTASTGIQVAVEKEGDTLGLFTKHLVEGIRSGEADRDEDGFVDIHELYQHVYEKVRAEGAQEPMKWNLHAKGKMIVAKSGREAKEKRRQQISDNFAREVVLVTQPKAGDILRDEISGILLVYIPAGCFMMGSPPDEEGHRDDESPVHKVCVDAFWMGKYLVTQSQWQQLMDNNPSYSQKGGTSPVEHVSWYDVQDFIKKLNSKSGKAYRLPTEAEWEYACRAGSSDKWYSDDLDTIAWYQENSGIHPVGEKKANAFGLHDMLGNIWEWCADYYDSGYYASSIESNPTGPKSGLDRVIRGGIIGGHPGKTRAAFRSAMSDSVRFMVGFRLVLPVQAGGELNRQFL